MKSLSFTKDDIFDGERCRYVWEGIQTMRPYINKVSKGSADTLMGVLFVHAMEHFDPAKGDIRAYVVALSKNIWKNRHKEVFSDETDFLFLASADKQGSKASADGVAHSVIDCRGLDDDIANKMELEEGKSSKIAELALVYTNFFILLCESLITKNSTTKYFPDNFIKECLRLSKVCNFNRDCLLLYDRYKDDLTNFLAQDIKQGVSWREADYTMISSRVCKRASLESASGEEIFDLDLQPLIVKGNIKGKSVIRIKYSDILNSMADLIESDGINAMRFTIDGTYITKTLGGSLSTINPNLFNIYDLCKDEILSNMLRETEGRYLGSGSSYMYFLIDEVKPIKSRTVKGVDMKFEVEVLDL